MTSPLQSLIASGTKIWLDSVDPDLVRENFEMGATGATSNPIIIGDLIKTGRFDDTLETLISQGKSDEEIAWLTTDKLVSMAQQVFLPIWEKTRGDDGYVSFELDPLLEDTSNTLSVKEKASAYIELGRQWARGHRNRLIKIPATPGGLAAIEELAASGVTLNVTLVFTPRQYRMARDNMWKGAQRAKSREHFKSVYSIFVSRVDVYTQKHVPDLSAEAQGQVGIVNAKRIWAENKAFWADKNLPLQQEMIFASTGTKLASDSPDKYVEALAGADIQTNPPDTNAKVQKLGKSYRSHIEELPGADVLQSIDSNVNFTHLEDTLMREGLEKFADPQKKLIALIGQKRQSLQAGHARQG
jgi:transaldolase